MQRMIAKVRGIAVSVALVATLPGSARAADAASVAAGTAIAPPVADGRPSPSLRGPPSPRRPPTVVAAAPRDLAALGKKAAAHVASLPPSRVKALLERALGYLGTPYRWGGDDPAADGGFDCVGLAYYLFHASGMEFPLARFSSLNMTAAPRSAEIPAVWWTEYVQDFARTMQQCAAPFADGDLLIYHEMTAGRVSDRTGHAVIVVDHAQGLAVSAATGGVRLHALGDLTRYGPKSLTGCWRAASAASPPYVRPEVTWSIGLTGGSGTHAAPYAGTNPLDVVVAAAGPGIKDATLDVSGRVLSLIGAVKPSVSELPSDGQPAGTRRWRLHHDFKAVDLPVDPGEHIPTPQRKIVLRLVDQAGFVLGEKDFYVAFRPYW